MKHYIFAVLMLSSQCASAALDALDANQLSNIRGQGGADLSWSFSLNHNLPTNTTEVPYEYSCNGAGNEFCRLAFNVSNRKDASGNLYWLVFKKIQGTIAIDKFQLDGTTVTTSAGYKTAMKLTFLDGYPIQIRNFGFEALAIEKDSGTSDAQKGYLKQTTYSSLHESVFDRGLETGFTGLNMHGNLALSGTMKFFSCNSTATSRC